MNRFIKKVLIFILPAVLYSILAMMFMPYFLSLTNGPSTKEQIVQSFRNALNKEYELLILGNSRTYRGLNPDLFNYEAFNFSHDNDSYNQIYYKLKFLIDNKKQFKHLILGVDYFQFSFKSDSRNYVYADFLGDEYIDDYSEGSVFQKKVEYYLGNINPKKLLSIYLKKSDRFLRENGQYVKQGFAKESDSISRDINRLEFQVMYFKKTLELCKANDITTFLVMLPTRPNELRSYKENDLKKFDSFILDFVDHKNVFFLNYSKDPGFTTGDYTDITHFNESAANRFSKILNDDIMDTGVSGN